MVLWKIFRENIDLKPIPVQENIDLIRADFDNNDIESVKHSEELHYISIFKKNMEKISDKYDLVIFDTPGKKYAIRTRASLSCSHIVVMPFLLRFEVLD